MRTLAGIALLAFAGYSGSYQLTAAVMTPPPAAVVKPACPVCPAPEPGPVPMPRRP